MSAGKGDTPRPVDAQKWAANWDKIKWGKKDDKYPKKEKPKKQQDGR